MERIYTLALMMNVNTVFICDRKLRQVALFREEDVGVHKPQFWPDHSTLVDVGKTTENTRELQQNFLFLMSEAEFLNRLGTF